MDKMVYENVTHIVEKYSTKHNYDIIVDKYDIEKII